MSFATLADLADYMGMGTAVPGDFGERGQLLLDLATSDIQGYTGQTIEQVVGDAVSLDGYGRSVIFLPQLPVTAVASVVVDEVTSPSTDYQWTRSGLLSSYFRHWSFAADRPVTVTYTHGYATIPGDIKGVCLAMASRRWENPVGATRSLSVGTYSESFDAASTGVFTDDEERTLNRYRPLVIA